MLLHSLKHTPAADLGHKTTRVVLLCDHRNEESVVPLIECLSWYEGVELHVVDSQSAEGLGGKPPTVIPPSWDRREMQSRSLGAEALWYQCGPGRAHERVVRYSTRIGAQPRNCSRGTKARVRKVVADFDVGTIG